MSIRYLKQHQHNYLKQCFGKIRQYLFSWQKWCIYAKKWTWHIMNKIIVNIFIRLFLRDSKIAIFKHITLIYTLVWHLVWLRNIQVLLLLFNKIEVTQFKNIKCNLLISTKCLPQNHLFIFQKSFNPSFPLSDEFSTF